MIGSEFHEKLTRIAETSAGIVVARFAIHTLPDGSASEHVRVGWIGRELPVRKGLLEEVPLDSGQVPVSWGDAIVSLSEAGRADCALYWMSVAQNIGYWGFLAFQAADGDLSWEPVQPQQ